MTEESGSLRLETSTDGSLVMKCEDKEEWTKQLQASTVKSEGEYSYCRSSDDSSPCGFPMKPMKADRSLATVSLLPCLRSVVEKMTADEELRVKEEDSSMRIEVVADDEANARTLTTTGGTESLRSGSMTSVDGL